MERIDAVGLVLAGGHSRRLGRDKRWLPHEEGGSWLERTTALLARFCGEGRIAIATGESFDPIAGWPSVADPAPAGRGPLVGIDAAFRAHPGCDLCVLACDYPQIDAELLGPIYDAPLTTELRLAQDAEGRDHPLVARWSAQLAPVVATAVGAGRYRVGAIVEVASLERVAGGDAALINVNDADALEASRRADGR